VIGDAVGEVVSADALGAVAGADHALAALDRSWWPCSGNIIQPAAEDPPGLARLVLAALSDTDHNAVGRVRV